MLSVFLRYRCQAALIAASLMAPVTLWADISSEQWWQQVQRQLQQLPQWHAQTAQQNSTQLQQQQAQLARFNPSLDAQWEKTDQQVSYRLGLSQEIDWWDSGEATAQQATLNSQAMAQQTRWSRLQMLAQALRSETNWQAAQQHQQLASLQQQRLQQLLALLEQRQQQGDVGQLDAELAFLSLSEQQLALADAKAELITQSSERRNWLGKIPAAPADTWQSLPLNAASSADQHPLVALAKASWQAQQASAEATARDRRARPTIGLNAGKDEQQTVAGINLSVPLTVRNDYRYEQQSLQQQTLAMEARYRDQRRQWQQQLQQQQQLWQSYQAQWAQWQQHSPKRLQRSEQLLKQRWQQGDLSIADYLRSLNQLAASEAAAIELQRKTRLAALDLWLTSGQWPSSALESRYE